MIYRLLFVFSLSMGCTVAAAEPPKPGQSGPDAKAGPFKPAKDGSFTLHARQATVHGTTLRYEPAENKNTLGFWTDVTDWASWDLAVDHPAAFKVEILQGCGKDSGGSEVEVVLGRERFTFIVQETGHFQNFLRRQVGTLRVEKPGNYTLAFRPLKKTGRAIMDLREVSLKPSP
ncbi:MAG: DUF5077 domain-containing protein [Verrucomicrobiales bacterium]